MSHLLHFVCHYALLNFDSIFSNILRFMCRALNSESFSKTKCSLVDSVAVLCNNEELIFKVQYTALAHSAIEYCVI